MKQIDLEKTLQESKTFIAFEISDNAKRESGKTHVAEIKEMRWHYNQARIGGTDLDAKGFYLDNNVIDMIQKNPNIKSLYLYLGKKRNDHNPNSKHNGHYTVIAIPATQDINGNDTLIIEYHKNFEWHDPISAHPPTNEDDIAPGLLINI